MTASTETQRLFSIAAYIVNNWRNRLTGDRAARLIALSRILRIIDGTALGLRPETDDEAIDFNTVGLSQDDFDVEYAGSGAAAASSAPIHVDGDDDDYSRFAADV